MDWFPALRIFFKEKVRRFLPASPLRMVAGAAIMTVFVMIVGNIVFGIYAVTAAVCRQTAAMVDSARSTVSELGSSVTPVRKPETVQISRGGTELRQNINDGSGISEGSAISVQDAVRRVDYALVQAVKRRGIPAGNIQVLRADWRQQRIGSAEESYPFQVVSVRGVDNARKFLSSMDTTLGLFAKNVKARLVRRDGRTIIRLTYEAVRGGKQSVATHEVLLLPS